MGPAHQKLRNVVFLPGSFGKPPSQRPGISRDGQRRERQSESKSESESESTFYLVLHCMRVWAETAIFKMHDTPAYKSEELWNFEVLECASCTEVLLHHKSRLVMYRWM